MGQHQHTGRVQRILRQLDGSAPGILPHQELGFEKLCVSPDELLRKIDAAQAAKAAAAKADEATEEAKA